MGIFKPALGALVGWDLKTAEEDREVAMDDPEDVLQHMPLKLSTAVESTSRSCQSEMADGFKH